MRNVIDRYVRVKLGIPKGSRHSTVNILRYWERRLGNIPIDEITTAVLARERECLQVTDGGRGKPRSPATINRYFAALSAVFSVASREWGLCEGNPVRDLRKLKEPPGRVRYLTTDERQRLLQECRRSTNKTLYPLVLMALATGARKSELLRLAWRDIDFERGVVHILTSKNERPRSVPLVECARAALLVMPNGRPTVFPGTYQECWYHAVKRAELVDFRFHDLRHCCASYLAMSGVDVRTIAEILGHKTLQMTMRYSHLNTAALTEPLEAMALKFLEAKK